MDDKDANFKERVNSMFNAIEVMKIEKNTNSIVIYYNLLETEELQILDFIHDECIVPVYGPSSDYQNGYNPNTKQHFTCVKLNQEKVFNSDENETTIEAAAASSSFSIYIWPIITTIVVGIIWQYIVAEMTRRGLL